ncbi:M20 family metallopeptidase [Amycolatopsis alkalitolerans]|uniref:M20 family metallopeptidase n=1 Tax=Amycolatopsis alkalitolerans TaxID=2547244 RepID=A0A5C4M4L6_9PSEU|nr:M20 family metallopeptidase [Amycolatopsis alkalitolerans]TNC27642.1 M20 family metallopeptidase [Amycolatopsis alkalitolerans]
MPDVVALTRSLIGLDTVNHNESAALKVLAPLLEEAGFIVTVAEHEPGRGTLVADWHTDLTTPPLCLSGHVDTVPLGAAKWRHEPFGELDGDRLYGRGSSDMKGGVAAIVLAATKIAATQPKRAGLRLVLTAAEETGSLGARHAAEHLLDEPSGPLVIAEPTANAVVQGHKGALWLEALATGVTAHGSMPHLGDNAIYKLASAITRLAGHDFGLAPHPIMGPPTLNVGTIEGGLNTNSVPDRAVATIDVRTIAGQDHAEILAALARVAGDEVELRPLVDLPPVWTDPEGEWARAVAGIVHDVTGEETEARSATYFTDASVLTPAFGGVPTIICGPGEAEQAHVTDEWCSVTRLEQSAEIFERLCADWCQI